MNALKSKKKPEAKILPNPGDVAMDDTVAVVINDDKINAVFEDVHLNKVAIVIKDKNGEHYRINVGNALLAVLEGVKKSYDIQKTEGKTEEENKCSETETSSKDI